MSLLNTLFKAVPLLVFASGCVSRPQSTEGPSVSRVTSIPRVMGRNITPQGKISFTSLTYGFSVWLPTRPKRSQKKLSSQNGGQRTQFFFASKSNSVNYMVSVSPVVLRSTQWEATLDELQRGMLQLRQAQLQHVEKIQLAGFPGRDVEVNLDHGAVIFRSRFYVTPQGSYAVAAGGYQDAMRQQDTQTTTVFDSFRFTQKP